MELSDLEFFVSYEVIESVPPTVYLSALHTLKAVKVTHDNTTLVSWSTDFSSAGENTAGVVQDAKYKKKEAFEGLAAHLA